MGKQKNPFRDEKGRARRGYEKSAKAWDERQEKANAERRRKKMFKPPKENPFLDSAGKPRWGYENSAKYWSPSKSSKAETLIGAEPLPPQSGTLYLLTNSAYRGLVKIGWTQRSVEARVQELESTGVPAEFKIAYTIENSCAPELERQVHHRLRDRRYRSNREFFKCTVDEAKRVIAECARML